MSEVKRPHLVWEAYQSLLKRAEKCDTDPDWDWDRESNFSRHAMNAALDLRDLKAEYNVLQADRDALLDSLKDLLDDVRRDRSGFGRGYEITHVIEESAENAIKQAESH
jgi:hypothetical protein